MKGWVLLRLGASQPLGQTHQHTHPLTPAQPAQHLHLRSPTEASVVVLLWKHAGSDSTYPAGREHTISEAAMLYIMVRIEIPFLPSIMKSHLATLALKLLLFMVKLFLLTTCITGSPHHGNRNLKALLQCFSKN